MPGNSLSSFFQTVVAGVTEASKLLAPTWAAHNTIYWDYNPAETGVLGQTLNVAIPTDPSNAVADIGVTDVQLTDIAFTTTPIVYANHPQFGYVVRDFEQFNSPLQIRQVFADAALKAIRNNINGKITALFNSTNITTNATQSTTGHVVTVPQFLSGLALLADQRVPVQSDPANMAMLLPSTPYSAMLDGTTGGAGAAWNQAFIVGSQTAATIHENAKIPMAFGTSFYLDQQMPTTGSVGSRTFTGCYFHRYAVAGVSRPLPPPDAKVVDYTYVDFDKVSIRVQIGYNQYPKGGYIVTIDAGYGLKVVRENMAVLYSIAE